MSLNPLFSLTPNNPLAYTYDAANPNARYAIGYLTAFGGLSSANSPYRLQDQSANDEIIVGYDPVAPGDGTINSLSDDFYRRCTIYGYFSATNVATDNQYLLLAQLHGLSNAT